MYIPNEEWDELISEASDILNYLDDLFQTEPGCPESRRFNRARHLLHAFVNLEDAPLPPTKRKKLNPFQKRRKGHDLMRKFAKHAVLHYAKSQLDKIKKRKSRVRTKKV